MEDHKIYEDMPSVPRAISISAWLGRAAMTARPKFVPEEMVAVQVDSAAEARRHGIPVRAAAQGSRRRPRAAAA